MPKKLVLSDDSTVVQAVPDAASAIEYRTGTGTAVSNVKIWTASTLTTAAGLATFTPPSNYFTTIHAVRADVLRNVTAATDFAFAFVKTVTTTAIVVQVAESKTTTIVVGGSSEGLEPSGIGITVYLVVYGV